MRTSLLSPLLSWRDRAALLAALVVPLLVCVAVVPWRTSLPNTDAALIIVVAIVAVAAYGHRLAGIVASLAGAFWFDLFLTRPYDRLTITHRADIETAVLIVVVGVAVTELAVRARTARVLTRTDVAYLDAISSTAELVNSGAGRTAVIDRVSDQLTTLLGLRSCRFEMTRFGGLPRLTADGRLMVDKRPWDVETYGMPDSQIEILVADRDHLRGRFVVDPTPGLVVTVAARRAAVVLAGLVASGIAAGRTTV